MKQAVAYAFGGACDATVQALGDSETAIAAANYAGETMTRYIVEDGQISSDDLTADELTAWFDGQDPETGERRGRELPSPAADLVLDSTINAPKSYSVAAMLDPELAIAYDALQDRLRDRIITMWQAELNARRGAAGKDREALARIEVVELRHERSRSLDPHKHRHLWLNTKVLGQDGRWSNVDSRVMLRFQTVINAEGDLAARTDPEWVAALAAKGFTLNDRGEIEQLEKLVRPLSRRSQQIEANRAVKLAEWKDAHPGQEPDRVVLATIDQWAWLTGRPNKPGQLDESKWHNMVRDEIAAIDPTAVDGVDRRPVNPNIVDVAALDRELLAAQAINDADRRAAATGGRFSMFDLRAGAARAVAASGVVADRSLLTELIEDVTARGRDQMAVDVLDEDNVPDHIKGLMATATATLKTELADSFDRLTRDGVVMASDDVSAVAGQVLDAGRSLDIGRWDSAGAIAGTDRLVTVTGPAGTGKTTMLKVARELLQRQGRRMVVVAPTKKAASVAGRETGATASSIHALLLDHGWRWTETNSGSDDWSRLQRGQIDPVTGMVYDGPTKYKLDRDDRIVVDEAGMVDLNTARALADVAERTGAGIAMVGDHLQALPVGHSGAMSTMKRRSSAVVELTAVHRFTDSEGRPDTAYGELSLRLREPGSDQAADQVVNDLIDGGHVAMVDNELAGRTRMRDAWFTATGRSESIALVTATHAEAQAINEAIQHERISRGQISTTQTVLGQDDQALYVGDVIQTRRNNRQLDLENRATWTIKSVGDGNVVLARTDDNRETRTVPSEYLTNHAHLAYASTVHGIQGETTDRSIVGPGVDAAGLYVGMTRGRRHNEAIVVASTTENAKEQVRQSMRRGLIETTLDDAHAAAQAELGRAARNRPEEALSAAPWTDVKARPLGHVVDLDVYITEASQRQPTLHAQLERVVDRLAKDKKTLRTFRSRQATRDARHHQAVATGAQPARRDDPSEVERKLAARIDKDTSDRNDLATEYARLGRRLDRAREEGQRRALLPTQQLAAEDAERVRRMQTIRNSSQTSTADYDPSRRHDTTRPASGTPGLS